MLLVVSYLFAKKKYKAMESELKKLQATLKDEIRVNRKEAIERVSQDAAAIKKKSKRKTTGQNNPKKRTKKDDSSSTSDSWEGVVDADVVSDDSKDDDNVVLAEEVSEEKEEAEETTNDSAALPEPTLDDAEFIAKIQNHRMKKKGMAEVQVQWDNEYVMWSRAEPIVEDAPQLLAEYMGSRRLHIVGGKWKQLYKKAITGIVAINGHRFEASIHEISLVWDLEQETKSWHSALEVQKVRPDLLSEYLKSNFLDERIGWKAYI